MNSMKAIVAAGLVASTLAFAAGAGDVSVPALFEADAYKKETGNGLNYQSIGSGAGIKQIVASDLRPRYAAQARAAQRTG